jgi:hypothetical protein
MALYQEEQLTSVDYKMLSVPALVAIVVLTVHDE